MLILFDHGTREASPGFFTAIRLWKPLPEVGTGSPTALCWTRLKKPGSIFCHRRIKASGTSKIYKAAGLLSLSVATRSGPPYTATFIEL